MISLTGLAGLILLWCFCQVNASGGTYPSFAIEDLKKTNYIFDQQCSTVVQYIFDHQRKCQQGEGGNQVAFICMHFSTDVEFLLTSVTHHLLLGFRQVFIYNNDNHLPWFYHPLITCLISAELVTVHPWFGDGVQTPSYDHCSNRIRTEVLSQYDTKDFGGGIPGAVPIPHTNDDQIWIAAFDVDEYLVLHKEQCVQQFLHRMENYSAPAVIVQWAFFTPSLPFSKIGITQNNESHLYITLPFEMLTSRAYENDHFKTITRLSCLDRWMNPHYANFNRNCKYQGNAIDFLGRRLQYNYKSLPADDYYSDVQLNHYWALSLMQYLRKIHRGRGIGFEKRAEFRSTIDLFDHVRGNNGDKSRKRVTDTSFTKYYGPRFEHLLNLCPECFNVSYFYSH